MPPKESNILIGALMRLGDTPHRLEWFGDVSLQHPPQIRLTMAPWLPLASGEMSSDPNKLIEISAPISFLRLFRIGDIWRNGRFTGNVDLQESSIFEVSTEPTNPDIVPAGSEALISESEAVHLLPFSKFRSHRGNTHSFCAHYFLSASESLIIPCVELIRFYFGTSGSFIKRIFSGAFSLDNLFESMHFDRNTGITTIELAPDLSGTAATTVARIALNSQARSAAAWIVNSGTAAAANRQRYHPKTTFPFHGTSRLHVAGRWIRQAEISFFLVERILQCSAPFPFTKVFYTTKKTILKPKIYQSTETSATPSLNESTSISPKDEIMIRSVSSKPRLTPIELSAFESDTPFPDLLRKDVLRVMQSNKGSGSTTAHSEAQFSAEDECSSGSDRGAEVSVDAAEAHSVVPPEVASYNAAFRQYAIAAKGKFYSAPIFPTRAQPRSPDEVFVRVSELLNLNTPHFRDTWAAATINHYGPLEKMLTLLREPRGQEDKGRAIYLGITDEINNDINLHQLIVNFANDIPSKIEGGHTLNAMRAAFNASLFQILRNLSLVVGASLPSKN